VPIVLKSWSLNLLEPSGPVQACNGIALPFTYFTLRYFTHSLTHSMEQIASWEANQFSAASHKLQYQTRFVLYIIWICRTWHVMF